MNRSENPNFLKSKAKVSLEKYFYCSFFVFRLYQEIQRLQKIDKFIKRNQLKRISDLEIEKYKSSDTLFVMGSGFSINDYTEKEWSLIGAGNSIGLNFWLIHDFVPTFYMFEPGKNTQRLNIFLELLRRKAYKYESTPFLLKDIEDKDLDLSTIPDCLVKNFYVPYKFIIPGSNKSGIQKGLEIVHDLKIDSLRNVLLFKTASISMAISFGVKMKYKRIVLCGVDLNDTRYFYESGTYSRHIPLPPTDQTGSLHMTVDPSVSEVTIDLLISVLCSHLLKHHEISLFIGSKKSALFPGLPYFFGT